ncbi:hypothetical protein [Nostoc sp.]
MLSWLKIRLAEIILDQEYIVDKDQQKNMPANKKPETQGRIAQLGIKVDAELYEKYKTKLKEDGTSITEDIENHMRNYIGEMIVHSNVVDIVKLVEDVEVLKKVLGELQPGWQERMSSLKVS